jgi:hypothetical protein
VNASGNKLVYSNFTADGYQLKEMSLQDRKEIDLKAFELPANKIPVAKENDFSNLKLNDIVTRNFQ